MLVLLILVALVVVVSVVAAPLREPARAGEAPVDDEVEEAKLAKYRELREVELDWRTGKLSESDYQRIRAQLRADAAALLAEAELNGASSASAGELTVDASGTAPSDPDPPRDPGA